MLLFVVVAVAVIIAVVLASFKIYDDEICARPPSRQKTIQSCNSFVQFCLMYEIKWEVSLFFGGAAVRSDHHQKESWRRKH